ncbi:MAG: ribonuclease Y [Ruminococcaceae bacterium]|nr:ribonuclease Y [Oscillospiraceae bacterium]
MLILMAALAVVMFNIGMAHRRKIAEQKIGGAEEEARQIVAAAVKQAEAKKRESVIEAREEIQKNRTELEKEIRERRSELSKSERRLQQKEESLDRKHDAAEKKEEILGRKIKEAEEMNDEIREIKKSETEMLEKISGFTAEEAKEYLIRMIETDARHEAAIKIREIDQEIKETAERKAREYISLAIQKCAADHVSEAAISVVPLPNDEMKGRIIGREGRNIRTLETMTGVDLIIDDTPEAITLSSFDPVRREIARLTLEKLIMDGRIHPARIEEMIEKSRREVDAIIKSEGERAIFETGVQGLHPELIKLLGRMHYRTSYGQNVLQHSIEVAHVSGILAAELGLDITMAKRAGLLHDIGKAVDHETEGSHIQIGVDLARKYRENREIIHAIQAHHGDVEAETPIACIVQAADAISAARPGARRENLEAYIKRLEKLEAIANEFPGVEKSFAIQAGREIRIMVNPETVTDDNMVLLARDLAKKIESELEYPGQIKVSVMRETRAVDYAK